MNKKSFYVSTTVLVTGCILLVACTTTKPIISKQEHVINFAPITEWERRVFGKPTDYSIIKDGGLTVLKAVSNDSASMLYKKIRIDLNATPYLNWQWKISNTYSDNVDEHKRRGDDYPARIYIAIKSRTGEIYPRALSYVWSSNSKKLSHWKSAYTPSVVLFSIENGDLNANKWITEKRNLKQDLSAYFNESIDAIDGIAVMSDSDNTHSNATAFYRNIHFSSQ